jgi:hypothetical protein
MRLALPIALLGLAISSPALATGVSTLAEAKKVAARDNKPILVDFYAVW